MGFEYDFWHYYLPAIGVPVAAVAIVGGIYIWWEVDGSYRFGAWREDRRWRRRRRPSLGLWPRRRVGPIGYLRGDDLREMPAPPRDFCGVDDYEPDDLGDAGRGHLRPR